MLRHLALRPTIKKSLPNCRMQSCIVQHLQEASITSCHVNILGKYTDHQTMLAAFSAFMENLLACPKSYVCTGHVFGGASYLFNRVIVQYCPATAPQMCSACSYFWRRQLSVQPGDCAVLSSDSSTDVFSLLRVLSDPE